MTGSPVTETGHQLEAILAEQNLITDPVLSPKRPRVDTAGMADVFPYYAGFSFEWAQRLIEDEANGRPLVVLDPWNGSGTTTLAAQANGLMSIGVDLNPIASVVAQLRVQVGRCAQICSPPPTTSISPSSDPLSAWLNEETAARARQWVDSLAGMSRESSALALVAMFRVIRRITKSFEGSNPTWVKTASNSDSLIWVSDSELDRSMIEEQKHISSRLRSEDYGKSRALLLTASSSALPIADSSVDVILTSPPYMTRIDYAVAYARELAIMGHDISKDRTLRQALMGTTLIRQGATAEPTYGQLASDLVDAVSRHPSKASSGYYLKQARQYLGDLATSLEELTRVAKPTATMYLVVQDSYYKDVPINLADICIDEAVIRGWTATEVRPFEVNRILTKLNTSAQAYPKGAVVETVIAFRKERE